jgi:hypothetical protein
MHFITKPLDDFLPFGAVNALTFVTFATPISVDISATITLFALGFISYWFTSLLYRL